MAKQSGSKKGTGTKKAKATKTSEPQDEYTAQPEATPSGDAAPAAETTPASEAPATEAAPAKSSNGPTLYEVSEGYLAWLDKDGAGEGTISSYGMELKLAQRELGDNTPVADLTVDRVAKYFRSAAVMKTRTGKPKAEPTWKKTQRVLRLALMWAVDEKIIDVAPIPETKPAKLKAV